MTFDPVPSPARPGDAWVRAERIVTDRAHLWSHRWYTDYNALKQLIATEIIAAVTEEQARCRLEIDSVVAASKRVAAAAHQALDQADAIKAKAEAKAGGIVVA